MKKLKFREIKLTHPHHRAKGLREPSLRSGPPKSRASVLNHSVILPLAKYTLTGKPGQPCHSH